MIESSKDCDFCKEKTATGIFGKMKTNYSYSSANLFPMGEYHELFFARKHDFLKLDYVEFKDLMYLPIKWFEKVFQNNPKFKYPCNILMTIFTIFSY